MNKVAEKHLTKAKLYLAQGDELYRKAKGEIDAAIAAGASQREVSRYLLKSQSWVRDVIAWDGTGTLYGHDTEARQNRQARQVMREAPMEQVEQIIEVKEDVLQIEPDHSCGRKLDGERETVDAAADLPEETTSAIGVERCLCPGAGSLSKQAHRRARVDLLTARIAAHHVQWLESVAQLVQGPQRLSTRREDTKAWETSGEGLYEVGHGGHHVLAVVEHEQDVTFGQPVGQRILVGLAT